jgi:hypothetical protein
MRVEVHNRAHTGVQTARRAGYLHHSIEGAAGGVDHRAHFYNLCSVLFVGKSGALRRVVDQA